MAQSDNQKDKTTIDKLIMIAAIGTPVMTFPQVYQVWVQHVKGDSVVTWTSYVIIGIIWLMYGLKYKDKPIIIMQSLCIITYSLVVAGLVA
jgi:uncharacterized protein with PQ loop repeat